MVKGPPQLPAQLMEELGLGSSSQGGRHGRGKLSRKDARKQDRHDQKARNAQHHGRPRPSEQVPPMSGKRPATHEHKDSPPRKKVKPTPTPSIQDSRISSSVSTGASTSVSRERPSKSKKTALEKLSTRTSKAPVAPRSERDRQEDTYITFLEKKLGWRKGREKTKNYGTGLEDDGLGELLEGLDTFDDVSVSSVADDDDMSESENDYGDDEDIDEGIFPQEQKVDGDEWGGISSTSPNLEAASNEAPELIPVAMTKYVPPALRKKASETIDSEEVIKLKRQIKGQINRLSEQNISPILDTIEDLYRKNTRNDVSSSLTSLIIESVSSHAILLDSYVVLNAAFVTALFKIMGQDFGANFVQQVVTLYDKHRGQIQDHSNENLMEDVPAGGKESSNLVVLLTELYNFQLVSCVLMFDIIRELLDGGLNEFDVELLLKIMRNCGSQLRQDDPSALKDIVQVVQNRVSAQDNTSSRTKFMLETLINLKNNKLKKTGNAGQTGGTEAVERMKKFISGLEKKRHILAHEPLRMSLADLRSADMKGKWWVVGAAWAGNPLVDQQTERQKLQAPKVADVTTENVLLKLAKKQGMNTDIRRSIFVVLMSSEDYVDACERLGQLNLTEIQQREIVRVILHCCGNEKSFNPYYTLVTQHLCSNSHSHKITLQFSLWDFLRDLGETSVGGAEMMKDLEDNGGGNFGSMKKITEQRIRNIARLYAWLVAKDRLALTILKPIDFTSLKKQARSFFVEFFSQTFFSTQLANPSVAPQKAVGGTFDHSAIDEVFMKAIRVPNLTVGIIYFLSKHIAATASEGGDDGSNVVTEACQAAIDTLRSGLDVARSL